MADAEDDNVSAYERQRVAKMLRNKQAMESLGLIRAMDEIKQKRQAARAEVEACRKRHKTAEKAEVVPRRTGRHTKPISFIQHEWRDPRERNRLKIETLKHRLASLTPHMEDACLLCGLVVARAAMRQHVGAHIVAESFAAVRCGLCGLESSTCEHKVEAGIPTIVPVGDVAVAQLCPRFFPVVVKRAAQAKCTNVPLRCSKCRQWLWTYTMKQHWASIHGSTKGMTKKEAAASTVSGDEVAFMLAEMERINFKLLEIDRSSSSDDDSAFRPGTGDRGGIARSYSLRVRKPLAEIDTDDNEFSSAPDSDYNDGSD
ncbi:hypothetical protein H310_14374 [Aphanomyces invadans]|uniref:Uncharacterized protein n=1 Tax=Aphanomyces invadans TaxID=157072 RepID=A0A024TA14_9STRA|nr:hypothetical protein H310_14374 [Aphanomyces invadans]ETV90878.1 hypothetical protein H310_14374 [Aphanomyces invadans]|eukprot:XP_008880443.1 hypothetical protein H310_14374 [Aphanomyces invadans]